MYTSLFKSLSYICFLSVIVLGLRSSVSFQEPNFVGPTLFACALCAISDNYYSSTDVEYEPFTQRVALLHATLLRLNGYLRYHRRSRSISSTPPIIIIVFHSNEPRDGHQTTDTSSISSGRLTGLLIGSALGLLAILACVWLVLRYAKRVTARLRKLKKRLQVMVGLAVLGVYLFGPPLFQGDRRDEEPEVETGNEDQDPSIALLEQQHAVESSQR